LSKSVHDSARGGIGINTKRVIEETPWLGYLVACCLAMALLVVGYAKLLRSEHHLLIGDHKTSLPRARNRPELAAEADSMGTDFVDARFKEDNQTIQYEPRSAVVVEHDVVLDTTPIDDKMPSEAMAVASENEMPSEARSFHLNGGLPDEMQEEFEGFDYISDLLL
jgi:hypothetical protein